MKQLVLSILFISFGILSKANHITGGEMYYTLISQNGSDYNYHIVLKLYRDCFTNGAQLDDNAPISIFDRITGATVFNTSVPRNRIVTLNLGSPSPCITNPPPVCYEVGYYEFDITLAGSTNGYVISYQRCCRIQGINNLSNSSSVGATYTAEIPGTSSLFTAPANNSAKFIGPDTVVVCAASPFTYSFAATDADPNDVLSYSFCNAYLGGGSTNGSGFNNNSPNPPSPPAYTSVPYSGGGFNGSSPLGTTININPITGLLTGIAPAAGIYVVTVCVTESRSGIAIAVQRKDLQIKIGDCTVAAATLKPEYISCDGFTNTFSNLSSSPLINSHFWNFGVASQTNDTSNLAVPTFTFPDTGVYTIKLITNRNQACSDSATAIVRVFPGFFPDFTSAGICVNKPTNFNDRTTTVYGVVDSWSWDFADITTNADTSHLRNPAWTYSTTGPKDVILTVTNSKGCIDTAVRTVTIIDKPPITLPFRDTLICVPDNLQLQAFGSGLFSWTPNISIINANTATPTVNPVTTTTYHVNLNDNGCLNNDSVRVRVITIVTLIAMNDTTICKTDPVTLRANTDALRFTWSPAASLNNPNIANPIAIPLSTTTYTLVGRVGSCTSFDDVQIKVVPYPIADAGPDEMICYQTSTQLNGSTDAPFFSWSPGITLSSTTILNPFAFPKRTSPYFLTVRDTLGCPKPVTDTVTVTVLPRMSPFAGRDTAVVIGESLQFNASGGITYLWTPPTGLSSTTIFNPVGNYGNDLDSIRYKLYVRNEAGCLDSATVLVKVFKTAPSIFVPTGFTPNGDGLNDLIAPIAVGIKRIEYFRIYNRWGQMVFSTTINGKGWDGTISGIPQSTNTYVWICSAIDYLDKRMFLKGQVTLIR